MTKKRIIEEVVAGNGNQFTVKELLQAHIRDGKSFEKYVRDKFEDGATKIAINRTNIKSIQDTLKYAVSPILFVIIGALITISL